MYSVFNTNTGSIVSRHRSAENAQKRIDMANKDLRRNRAFANSYTPWDICGPDQEIMNAGRIYSGRNGAGYQAVDRIGVVEFDGGTVYSGKTNE